MPFNLKKLTERRVELMTQLENMVKNCETETRAFNEEEQTRYNEILAEVRSIDTTLDAADQGAALQQMNAAPPAARRSPVPRRSWKPAPLSAISAVSPPMWRPVRQPT